MRDVRQRAIESIALRIDTADYTEALKRAKLAGEVGARLLYVGMGLLNEYSPETCGEIVSRSGADWIADLKLHDEPDVVVTVVDGFRDAGHVPVGLTIHAAAGFEAMSRAQQHAQENHIDMLAVLMLSSVAKGQSVTTYHTSALEKSLEFAYSAAQAGLGSVVVHSKEVLQEIRTDNEIKHLSRVVPAVRLTSVDITEASSSSLPTPTEAIHSGANLIVASPWDIDAENPAGAYEQLLTEVEEAYRTMAS